MSRKNNLMGKVSLKAVIKRMMLGAVIGLVLISFFIFSVGNPAPEWGKYWRIKPLIITPVVAAFGFLSFYLKEYINPKTDAGKIVVFFVSTIAFIVALWLGTVLGLDGTLWN